MRTVENLRIVRLNYDTTAHHWDAHYRFVSTNSYLSTSAATFTSPSTHIHVPSGAQSYLLANISDAERTDRTPHTHTHTHETSGMTLASKELVVARGISWSDWRLCRGD